MAGLARILEDDEAAEVHGHMAGECPWYKAACDGEDVSRDDPDECQRSSGVPRLVVKLTPHTAEASTVPKPTVPPGGPGLFHVKGMQLPPYIQHLWYHLAPKYGKHRAYGMAVGIVKKWKDGINPGGWKTKSGKGKKTHPDVQAAAARNIAEWEKDRARAHAQSASTREKHDRHVAAAASSVFPDSQLTVVPPTPRADKAIFTAHRVHDTLYHISHAVERVQQLQGVKTAAERHYHAIHLDNHLSLGLDGVHELAANLRSNYPGEARELRMLTETIGMTVAVSPVAKVATMAHLTETLSHELAHAKRHSRLLLDPEPLADWNFNLDHVVSHVRGAHEHVVKIADHVTDNYPAEAGFLAELRALVDGRQQVALAQVMNIGTASSASAQYGLHQHPSQTVSPSPPLPPDVPRPTPAEVRALARSIPECSDVSLANSVATFLETAATKLEKDDDQGALAALRSVQSSVYAASKKDLGHFAPVTYAARVVPAEQSSVTTAMLQGRDRQLEWRRLFTDVNALVERMRKRYFHGRINGVLPNMRLSGQEPASALDRVVTLAGAGSIQPATRVSLLGG